MAKTRIPDGLQLFKLTGFDGDNTKNCSLTACELDGNFIHLKSLAIDTQVGAEYNEATGEIILHFIGGKTMELPIKEALGDAIINKIDVSYDQEDGEVIIHFGDEERKVVGFVTSENIEKYLEDYSIKALDAVYHDDTLKGNGHPTNPLGIEPTRLSGMAPAVEGIINIVDYGQALPEDPDYGAAYVTKEAYTNAGRLYNMEQVKEILSRIGNGWRLPTKADFDGILNAIECEGKKNHDNREEAELGEYAGKALRAKDLWKPVKNASGEQDMSYWGNGLFGFNVYPGGFGDTDKKVGHVGDWAQYWTSTPDDENSTKRMTSYYTKRFEHDRNGVYQTSVSEESYCAIRLVKDIPQDQTSSSLMILDKSVRVGVIPSDNGKNLLWTLEDINVEGIGVKGRTSKVSTTAYFINVWNGNAWDKRMLKDGDSFINKTKEKNINNKNVSHTLYIIKNGKAERYYEPIPVSTVEAVWKSVFGEE